MPARPLGGFVQGVPEGVRGAIADDGAIHEGPQRLHEIADETEGVVAVVVMQSKGGMEAGGASGAGDDGAEHGVTIIEEGVGAAAVAVAVEGRIAKEGRPIATGGLRFDVDGVAGADLGGEFGETRVVPPQVHQGARLGLDLRFNEGLPESLAGRQGGLGLEGEAFGLERVAIEREQHRGGHALLIADNGHAPLLGEAGEDGLAQDSLRMGDYEGGDFGQGDGDAGLLVARNDQAAQVQVDPGRLLGQVNDALHPRHDPPPHRADLFCLAPFRCPSLWALRSIG